MKHKPLFLVYVENPMCSIDCADAICEVLESTGRYKTKLVGPHSLPYSELTEEELAAADCLAIPGGLGDADQYYTSALASSKQAIRSYVSNGGRYLGICMGSYYAGHYYLDLLHKGTRAAQYVRRPGSTVKHEEHDVVDLDWLGEQKTVYFHDGAAFVKRWFFNKVTGQVIARYPNGDAAALIQSKQQGKVGVIGPHPEAKNWWFYSQTRIRDRWYDCVHNELLVDFVERLLA